MRGKLTSRCGYASESRITPAHAGKTLITPLPQAQWADHPRACGENCDIVISRPAILGSPPRMRGKHRVFGEGTADMRITPAHAGKTLAVLRAQTPLTDHPRACGENIRDHKNNGAGVGSPPRMRGKRFKCNQ